MTAEKNIIESIASFNKYDESSKKYLDDGPAKYDIIIKLLGLQKEYQQTLNELDQLNYNFNQGIPMDQIRQYQRKGVLFSMDGSKRTCVDGPGVCSSNNADSQIKFQDFFDPSVRKDMDRFGSQGTTNTITPFYVKDSNECSDACKNDEKCGMWLFGDMENAVNSINGKLEDGEKYNDINKNLVGDPSMDTVLSKSGGGILGWMNMMFGKDALPINLGGIKKGTQIVRGNCFNIPTDRVGKNIKCNQPNSVIGNTMFDMPKVNQLLGKTFGLDQSIITPDTVKYSSGYCADAVDVQQANILAESDKNFQPIKKRMMKDKNEYIKMRNEKEKKLRYISIEMKDLLDKRSQALDSARMNIEASRTQVDKIAKKQDEIDANVTSFNNSVREYEEKVVFNETRNKESLGDVFKYTFWLTLFICFLVLLIRPQLLSKPVSYALMSGFSLYVIYKIYTPLLEIIGSIFKLLKNTLWSNNNI